MSSKLLKATRFCGSCQHYNWTLGPQRKTTCNNLGCIDTTPSCTDYSINPFILQDFENVLKPLADVLRVMPITTLSMFYEIIAQEKQLRRRGYYFMEKVAIKYWGTPGDKFVSNYVIAHVYSATNDGVFVIAKTGIRMFVLKDSLMKLEEFLELRRELKSNGKIVDPTLSSRASTKQKLAVTETLDDIIARGCVEDFEIDTDIKRKLNPKRINDGINKGLHPSEVAMGTKKKRNPFADLDGATELSFSTKKKKKEVVVEDEPVKKKKKKDKEKSKKPVLVQPLFLEKVKKNKGKVDKKLTPFEALKKRKGAGK